MPNSKTASLSASLQQLIAQLEASIASPWISIISGYEGVQEELARERPNEDLDTFLSPELCTAIKQNVPKKSLVGRKLKSLQNEMKLPFVRPLEKYYAARDLSNCS